MSPTALHPTSPPAHAVSEPRSHRLVALDVWRGLVVALMAIDHAAAFVGLHPPPEGLMVFGRALRPEFTSDVAWLTRFVTHYCAPAFVFLAGTSVALLAASRLERGWSELRISGHLVLRGALLVVLEYTLVAWGWGSATPVTFFQVIACIGACMILGAGLRFLPARAAVAAGAVLVVVHPVLADPELVPWVAELPGRWRRVLLVPEPLAPRWPSLYPVLPWLAVFVAGIGYGKLVLRDRERALRRGAAAGAALLLAWLAIRLTGGFADLLGSLGSEVERLGTTTPYRPERGLHDFFAMSKYPPLADFVCWTLGGGLLLLGVMARTGLAEGRAAWSLRVLGRVPLFFYVVHLYLYRWLANAVAGDVLPVRSYATVWVLWALGLVVLVPACRLYGALRRRHPGFPLDLL